MFEIYDHITVSKKNISFIFSAVALILLSTNFMLYQILNINDWKIFFRIASLFFSIMSMRYLEKINSKVILFFLIMLVMIIESSEGMGIVYVFCISFFMKDKEEEDITKGCFIACLGSVILYIILLCMHMVEMHIYTYGGRIRNDLGFLNINTAAAFFLSFVLLSILYRKNTFSIVCGGILEVLIFALTDSRTSLIVFIAFVFFLQMFRICEKNKRFVKIYSTLSNVIIIVCYVFPFVSSFLIVKFPFLNKLFSNRIFISASRLTGGTFKDLLFGGRDDWRLDNSILCLFFLFGIFVLLFFLVCMLKAMKNLWKSERYYYIAFLLAIVLGGMMESYLVSPELLFSFLFWFIVFKYSIFYRKCDGK